MSPTANPLDDAIAEHMVGPIPPPLHYFGADMLLSLALQHEARAGADALLVARERVLASLYDVIEFGAEGGEWLFDQA